MADLISIRPIPVATVSDRLSYDPILGVLRWRVSRGRVVAGQIAGTVRSDRGYCQIRIDGRIFYAHRLAWVIATGADIPNGKEVDHKDGNPSNNRWSNLRLATPQQNKRNMRSSQRNTSGTAGVTFRRNRGKWQAQISVGNECRYLGSFNTREEAISARAQAERELFGEFAAVNRKA